MRPDNVLRSLLRNAHFESFEERLLLTAQPLADFYVDDFLVEHVEHQCDDVELALADVHDTTGVNYVRDTYGFNGAGQTVAVIDSGIAYDHYALGGGFGSEYRVVGGWDFTEENDADPYDDGPAGFHGTHVAGIIGSNDVTYTGVASGVDLVALRVFNDQGAGYFSWVEDALEWVHDNRDAFENPITTVNLSLGTNWNAADPPSWAMLEDEFAQLKDDGIFISAAAGNSFTSYNTPGLSYPAASPYVVPVSSVTNGGTFSYFSQRHDRAIAAPGQSITSTVPDYLFDFNGVTDDFATASGTSMAAPYVAGASVLVREAMEFVGYQNIAQDTLYDHLWNTADVFHDSVTDADYAIAIDDIVVSYMYSKVYLEILVRNVGVERISNIRFLCKLTYPGEYTYAEYLFREGIASGHLNTESDSEYSSEMPQTIEILQVTLNGTMLMDLSSPYIIVP